MFKQFFSQLVVDLGELEGEYRIFHLKDDISHSILYISIAIISVFSMIRIDRLLYQNRPDLILWLIFYRGGYIIISIVIVIALLKTNNVNVYDRLVIAWMMITIFFLLLLNFARPATFLNTAFDVIVPFAIY